jgi:hypothetical protein
MFGFLPHISLIRFSILDRLYISRYWFVFNASCKTIVRVSQSNQYGFLLDLYQLNSEDVVKCIKKLIKF